MDVRNSTNTAQKTHKILHERSWILLGREDCPLSKWMVLSYGTPFGREIKYGRRRRIFGRGRTVSVTGRGRWYSASPAAFYLLRWRHHDVVLRAARMRRGWRWQRRRRWRFCGGAVLRPRGHAFFISIQLWMSERCFLGRAIVAGHNYQVAVLPGCYCALGSARLSDHSHRIIEDDIMTAAGGCTSVGNCRNYWRTKRWHPVA